MGNQFIQMFNGKQVLISFYGIQQRPFIHGEVVDSHKDMYLVRDSIGNGAYQLYHCPIGDSARPQSPADTDRWVKWYEEDNGVAA